MNAPNNNQNNFLSQQVIHREDDEIYETLEVELNKKKERGLGLSIVGKKSGPGVFISEVVKGGAADIDGRLVQGDQVSFRTLGQLVPLQLICQTACPLLGLLRGSTG